MAGSPDAAPRATGLFLVPAQDLDHPGARLPARTGSSCSQPPRPYVRWYWSRPGTSRPVSSRDPVLLDGRQGEYASRCAAFAGRAGRPSASDANARGVARRRRSLSVRSRDLALRNSGGGSATAPPHRPVTFALREEFPASRAFLRARRSREDSPANPAGRRAANRVPLTWNPLTNRPDGALDAPANFTVTCPSISSISSGKTFICKGKGGAPASFGRPPGPAAITSPTTRESGGSPPVQQGIGSSCPPCASSSAS